MARAKHRATVTVHYTGRLDDGAIFDTSADRGPMKFTIGEGGLIPAFEQAVIGMKPGESRTIRVPADQAYGPHRKDWVKVVDRERFRAGAKLKVGQEIQLRQANGQKRTFVVADLAESRVTLDANHPLAGKDLTFDIQLVVII